MDYTIKMTGKPVFIKHQFEEPPEELYLSVSISKKVPVFVRLYNPDGCFIGQIHFDHNNYLKELHIANGRATHNAMVHDLLKGTYTLVVISLGNEAELSGHEVSISIHDRIIGRISSNDYQTLPWFGPKGCLIPFGQISDSECRYYKGDFHSHTTLSDGEVHPLEVKNHLVYEGLEFTAMTEHNLMPFGFRVTAIPMVPSYELTLPEGHMNIHGLEDSGLLLSSDVLTDVLTDLNGYLRSLPEKVNVSINHMFMDPWDFRMSWLDLQRVNTIEVICDPTYPTASHANDRAVAFLDFLWGKGHKIYGIGGSDSHNRYDQHYEGSLLPSVYGDPGTYVYCQGLSIDNVLNGVKCGHTYVSRFHKLNIRIGDGSVLPGSDVTNIYVDSYEITLDGIHDQVLGKAFVGRFVLDGLVVKEETIDDDNPKVLLEGIQDLVSDRHWHYLRFGIYDSEGHDVAYVNPIYWGVNEPVSYELGPLLKEFDSND